MTNPLSKDKVLVELQKMKTGKFWLEMLLITLVTLVISADVYYFMMPSNFIAGSFTGLLLVINTLASGDLNIGLILLICNIFFLILGSLLVGLEFGIKSIYASLIYGPCINLWAWICPWQNIAIPNAFTGGFSVMGDIVLDMLICLVLAASCDAFLLLLNASSGGFIIVAKIISKYAHCNVYATIEVLGIVVVLSSIVANPFRMVILCLLMIVLMKVTMDICNSTVMKRKKVSIIVNDEEVIQQFILNELHRGCGISDVVSGVHGDSRKCIDVVLRQNEYYILFDFIQKNEIRAYVTATDIVDYSDLLTRNISSGNRKF